MKAKINIADGIKIVIIWEEKRIVMTREKMTTSRDTKIVYEYINLISNSTWMDYLHAEHNDKFTGRPYV